MTRTCRSFSRKEIKNHFSSIDGTEQGSFIDDSNCILLDTAVVAGRPNVFTPYEVLEPAILFPNPTTGRINLIPPDTHPDKRAQIILTNVTDREIRRLSYAHLPELVEMDISELQAGVYFLSLLPDAGPKQVFRLIKQ